MADVLEPLVWNGSTLTMPKASATQDGYLSHGDYVLFSGGTVVPVTSFNARTGDIILWEDDVLAALGYVPLNKHGDTMTGPLTLSGDPTLPLHAATRQYVLASTDPAAAPPATWYTRDFNASGSDARFTGTASTGSPTLTLSAAHDFAIGQGILVKGAGSSSSGISGALLTKVDGVAGNVITLHDPVPSAVTAVASNVMHDDTIAINTAFQAVVDGKGGKLVFDPGTYNVNGPVLSSNSILRLPYNATTNPAIAISMIGQPQPGMCFTTGLVGPAQYGVIIQTEVHNTAAAIFAATAYFSTLTDIGWFNNITLFMDGFTFRTYDNPQISAVDMAGCDNICFRNIQIDTGIAFYFTAAQPTATATYGLRAPAISAGMANHFIENIGIFNYYTGLKFSDLLRCNYVEIFRCMVGMEFMQSYYTAYFYSCLVWHCPTTVYIAPPPNGTCRGALDMSLTIEYNHLAQWDAPIPGRDLYDPGDIGCGVVKALKVAGDGIGSGAVLSVTGFSKADVFDFKSGTHLKPVSITGNLTLTGDASVGGNLSLTGQAVTAGLDNSATAAGYRELQVPNATPISLLANLVSYWKLDEASGTRADSHGSSPFTPVTTVGSATGRYGTLGASFAATNHLEATGTGLQTGNNSFTAALWVKFDSKTTNQDFLMKGTGSGQNEYYVGYDVGNDKFRFGMVSAAGAFTTILASSAGSPVVGTWYLIVAWFDYPNDQMHIQVNNGTVDSGVPPLPQNADTAMLNCGSYGNGLANGAFATVDEIAFWKPRVLDSATRAAIWNSGSGVPFGSWT